MVAPDFSLNSSFGEIVLNGKGINKRENDKFMNKFRKSGFHMNSECVKPWMVCIFALFVGFLFCNLDS